MCHIRILLSFLPLKNLKKNTGGNSKTWFPPIKKADDGNRTRDLRLTKATLYRLSHISELFFKSGYYNII